MPTEPTTAAPTQELRDLIDDVGAGLVSERDLNDALSRLEATLGIAQTHPTPYQG